MDEAAKVHQARVEAVLRALLHERTRPLPAVELAERAGMHFNHETNRRRIREIVAELREEGRRICAGFRPSPQPSPCQGEGDAGTLGYWMARDDGEWQRYCEARRANARFEFAIVREMQQRCGEAQRGQGKLFSDAETRRHSDAGTEWARA